jgi:hypothetical protein
MSTNFINRRFTKPGARHNTVIRRRAAPFLEILENRTVLSVNANQGYVAYVYHDLLHRNTDPAYQGWADLLDNGADPLTITREIQTSPEDRLDEVEGVYQSLLGRSPDPAGLDASMKFLDSGGTMNSLDATVFGSSEFFSDSGGSAGGFTDSLYQDILGREADPTGAAFWESQLASGTPPSTVAMDFEDSTEGIRKEVSDFYTNDLARQPDTGGLNGWVSRIEQGEDPPVVEASMLSIESLKRISNYVSTTGANLLQSADQLANQAITAFNNLGFTSALVVNAPKSFTFSASEGNISAAPSSQTFTIVNAGKSLSTLKFTIQGTTEPGSGSWLEVQPSSGSLTAGQTITCTVIAHPQNLKAALGSPTQYNGQIVVSDQNGNSSNPIGVVLTINPTSMGQGTFSGTYSTTAICPAPEGLMPITGTVTVIIDSITPDPNNPGVSIIKGQATVTGVCGVTIGATFDKATLDTTTNTIKLGTIGTTNQVGFSDTTFNGSSFTTSLGFVLNGQPIPLQDPGATVTLSKQ